MRPELACLVRNPNMYSFLGSGKQPASMSVEGDWRVSMIKYARPRKAWSPQGRLAAWRGNGTLMGYRAQAHPSEGASLDLSKKSLAPCQTPGRNRQASSCLAFFLQAAQILTLGGHKEHPKRRWSKPWGAGPLEILEPCNCSSQRGD